MYHIMNEGIRWGITYLYTRGRLSMDDKDLLVYHATSMYLLGEEEREVKGENFDGIVYTTNKHQRIGAFAGLEYVAEVETDNGKADISFLVAEYKNPRLN